MNQGEQNQSTEQIQADIRQTRADMSAKIDHITERLSPEQLKVQAQQTINELLTDSANSVSDYVRDNRRQITSSMTETIKRNPVPAALVGVGLGWMLIETFSTSGSGDHAYRQDVSRYRSGNYGRSSVYDSRSSAEEMSHEARYKAEQTGQQVRHGVEQTGEQIQHGTEQIGRKAQHVGEQAARQAREFGEQVGHQTAELGSQAQYQAKHAAYEAQRSMEENPLAFAALAFAAGIGMGLMLPQTRTENRMMGETSEQLKDAAQETARETAQRAQNVAEEVWPDLERTAQEAQEKAKAEAEGVKEKAKDETSRVDQTDKNEATNAAEKANTKLDEQDQSASRSQGSST